MFQIFNDFTGKKQYFLDELGIIWLHGTLLCKKLGFSNPTKSIQLHTEEDERQKVDICTLNDAWFVNEYGVWGMILESKTLEYKEFRRELKYKILPSIRKDGGYISPDATTTQLSTLQDRIAAQMAAIEQSYQLCKDTGDERGLITMKSQLLNCVNRLDGATESPTENWYSISEVLERNYKLSAKRVQNSLAIIGKLVKAEYEEETGLKVKETPKHVGSGHHTDTIKVYPEDWSDRIVQISVSYWSVNRKDKKSGEEYTLIDLV